ncbi:unnamed protein product [Zymoseptoria tritici ST99CH_1A5]|uniref:LIM zinc-binding domain-containing protein n=2 Tax=Zymoseptoria tritici TaxID=1047171 RepID=A0A1X7RI90_ZYMT9|nr:unnamed protein product [Zymoseptoria tritici ST99CH_3D7]SMY20614.1 unnamed protein product [Zymoseptoria tritici ST99CH_1A5]
MLQTKEPPIPEPAYMSKQQKAQYLSGLRHDRPARPARPSGSRPAPPSKYSCFARAESDTTQLGNGRSSLVQSSSMPLMSTPDLRPTIDPERSTSRHRSPFMGRPLAKAPTPSIVEEEEHATERKAKRTSTYIENGTRWMDKQETRSLSQALHDMDLEEERKIHSAAQDEAAELVYKHRNPDKANAAYANPDLKDYRSHLRKGSYQRSHSSHDSISSSQRSASNGTQNSSSSYDDNAHRAPSKQPRKVSPPSAIVSVLKRRESVKKSYDPLAQAVKEDIAVAHRRSSSESVRIVSGEKKMFMHPNDKIWEDPGEDDNSTTDEGRPASQSSVVRVNHARITEERIPSLPPATISPLPSYVRKNPFARVRAQNERMERSNSAPTLQTLPPAPVLRHDRVEIQRNAPSQSRNPWYVSNEPLPPTPPPAAEQEADEVAPKGSGSRNGTPTKDGKEIRGDDIRAATSKTRKDYSPNLPRPTIVSDKPGRPIVSFEKRAKEIVLEPEQSAEVRRSDSMPTGRNVEPAKVGYANSPRFTPPGSSSSQWNAVPQITFDDAPGPSIPTINLPDDPSIPTINFPDDDTTPSISINDTPTKSTSSPRSNTPQRPLPHHSASAPVPQVSPKSTPHYTPSHRTTPSTLCAHCALPIAGRILSASGQRFHPACFTCYTCSTNLECVAFYPEPESAYNDRLAQQADDTSPRFYCHLDYHESFSPRCKTCTTPIESSAIVACGNTYHPSHFFCAQCGDPFDHSTPFVEKDGYAWCVGCHAHRTAPKCGGCRKPVLEVVVKALGRDWHEGCFCCGGCGGGFGEEGRFFLREEEGGREGVVCVGCEERRLKA